MLILKRVLIVNRIPQSSSTMESKKFYVAGNHGKCSHLLHARFHKKLQPSPGQHNDYFRLSLSRSLLLYHLISLSFSFFLSLCPSLFLPLPVSGTLCLARRSCLAPGRRGTSATPPACRSSGITTSHWTVSALTWFRSNQCGDIFQIARTCV